MPAKGERRLRDLDLNLLHALRALLEEKHVTRAARRCFLSQPAMSRVLERLRDGFGDALLVRTGRSYERTVRGTRLLRELESVMPRLEAMVRGEAFDPATSLRRNPLTPARDRSMANALSPTMTVRDFENSYWYLDQLKNFAGRIGIRRRRRCEKTNSKRPSWRSSARAGLPRRPSVRGARRA
jgi:DNA-binding transcriptional LysR family regulator